MNHILRELESVGRVKSLSTVQDSDGDVLIRVRYFALNRTIAQALQYMRGITGISYVGVTEKGAFPAFELVYLPPTVQLKLLV